MRRDREWFRVETSFYPEHNLAVIEALPTGDSRDARALDGVRELRREQIPGARVLVTGETAESVDYFALTDRWLPILITFVLTLSFILLTVAFRSIVVAATAILLNLLSVSAAYGILILVFEKGVGNELLGFQQVDFLEAWVPLFLFAVLFGLSMDYHVFLVSRIRERYLRSGDNDSAVAHGIGSTARLITGAALIIIAVFSGFAVGDLVMFQQMGFGVAVSLLIDATLIRCVLLPAAMRLLGELELVPPEVARLATGLPRRGRTLTEPIWTPSPDVLEHANVVRLMQRHGIEDYWELVRRSQEEPDWFWPAAIEDMGLEFSQRWEQVVDLSQGPEWATWFVGGKLNLAWNCVHRWARGERAEAEAAVWEGEDGTAATFTYAQLSDAVTRLAEALVRLGVEPGDRVALFLPMSPEVAIASHACAHIGAVQVPIFSGFAAPAVAARLQDSEAKVLITADGSLRRGRELPMKAIADDAAAAAPALEHVLVWRRLGQEDVPMQPGRDVFWDEAVHESPGELEPLLVDSEHPVPSDLHVRNHWAAQGRPPCPGRLSRLDHTGGLLPGRREAGRRHPLLHGHGLDHGAVDGGGRRSARDDPGLCRGRARLAGRPALAPHRARAGIDPRRVADPDPGARSARGS